jgi:hypothetical protein
VSNRRVFLFGEVPAAFASALLKSVRGTPSTRMLAWLNDTPANREEWVDIARFARIVTSDPTRLDGASSGRVEKYQRKDLFLETALAPASDGSYVVPVTEEGMGSIGMVWWERRPINSLELQFADSARIPSVDGVEVHVWVGTEMPQTEIDLLGFGQLPDEPIEPTDSSKIIETLWQGQWVRLPGVIETQNGRWRQPVELNAIPAARGAVHKVRWVFPPSAEKISIRRLWAFTNDVWDSAELRIELEHPLAGQFGEIEVYNGETLDPIPSTRVKWDLSAPIRLKLRFVKKDPPPGSTRTLLWFRLPTGSYAVAANDVLKHECVYIPQAGLFLASASATVSLTEYQKTIAGKKTVLDRVRDMPDQTLTQAMEKAHHSIQDSGPMLLSLACDNAKFILEPDGTVLIEAHGAVSDGLGSRWGGGKNLEFTTHLHGGWLPIPVRTARNGGITYKQTTFVVPYGKNDPSSLAWLDRRPLGVVQYSIENSSSRPTEVRLELSMTSDWKYLEYGLAAQRAAWLAEKRPRIPLQSVSGGAVAWRAGKLLAFLNTDESFPLRVTIEDDVLRLEGTLAPAAQAKCWAYLPRWEMDIKEYSKLRGTEDLLADVTAYWVDILRSGTQIELPDSLLMNIIRASQVHCLISSRNEADGERIEQWGASTTYRGLNALYYTIPSMDLLGFHDFAHRAIDYYISRYTPDGLLSDGYTLAGIGWNLELIWDHYLLTRDIDWLRKISPQMERACWWIIGQKEKSKKLDTRGNKLPEYGLTPPGVTADWSAYNYYFCLNGYFYDGLQSATKALSEIGYEDVPRLHEHTKDFRGEILRAYNWAQIRMPVNPLQNGTWVLPYPSQVPLPGTMGLFFPGEDDNRPTLGCFDVELGASNMVPLGVLDPSSPDVRWMLDHLEDFWFLSEGWHDFPAATSEKDWFNLGGFSKVQPNLCRVPEIYATLDDIKPFVRSYFNFIAPQINKQNLTFWEDFTPDTGAWGSTEGSGYFLLLTRLMLLMERGEELWLAPLVTDQWLKNGMQVSVQNAPTRFGSISYRIMSFADKGYIEAEINPPTRLSPKEIVIRLRHPQGRRIRAVTVDGVPHTGFDSANDIVRLKPATETLHVKAEY